MFYYIKIWKNVGKFWNMEMGKMHFHVSNFLQRSDASSTRNFRDLILNDKYYALSINLLFRFLNWEKSEFIPTALSENHNFVSIHKIPVEIFKTDTWIK